MERATLILGLRQGVFTGRFILILYWQSAVLRIWSIRPDQGELNVIKRSKYHLQFCRFWLFCGTWQNILNSRRNRSKNKLVMVSKNTVAWVLEYSNPLFLIKNIGGGGRKYLSWRGRVTQPRIDLSRLVQSFRKRGQPLGFALSSTCHFNKFQGGASSSFLL